MDLEPGYKRTKAGVIPEAWDCRTIDEVGFVTSGKRLPLGCSLVRHQTPHPYIRVTDMRPGTVSLSEIMFVPESVFPAIKRYRIYSDDIFISVAGTLGIVGKIPKELDGANLTENADRITNITCSQDYLLHVLMSPLIQNTIDSIRTVGAQPKLALTRIRTFAIPLPPIPEQRAIAEALSNVDALLGALDRLIAKKRDLKQAAMQQLLTGQIRLPGFHGEWEETTLGNIGKFKNGLNKDSSAFGHGSPFVNLMDVFGVSAISSTRHLGLVASTKMDRDVYDLRQGDVLFIRSSVKPSGVGLTAVVERDLTGTVYSGFLIRFRDEGALDSGFKKHCFYAESFRKKIIAASSVSANTNINQNALGALTLLLPPTKAEQTAIAEVLTEMDAELAALEQRREKTRALKQGMMQELLTGRTRLL